MPPQEPVIKQEPCWTAPPTPTTPTAALGQLGLGPAGDPFSSHGFLQQHQQQLQRGIKTDPGEFEHKQPSSTSQMRSSSKRRPGPYDNLKDPSGKINLELVGFTETRFFILTLY